jgi:GT2 family glycosyltransferase
MTPQQAAIPSASIVIPTWNGAHWLGPCLDSLRRQTLWGRFETIVVDNGSTDGTSDVLGDHDWVQVIRFAENRGFAPAANAGIERARADVIVLLNNDTEAEPDWLEELLTALAAAPAAGMAASKILTLADRRVLHTTGDTVDAAGAPGNRGAWELDRGQWDGATAVFGACGAAAAYRRALFDSVGPFEERFESYLEDVDLAWRARLAGFDCVFAPRAVVYHSVSATGGGAYASFRVARNRIWLIVRNYPARPLLRNLHRVAASIGSVALDAARHSAGAAARATLRGLVTGIVTSPSMLGSRRAIQAGRLLSDGEFEVLVGARSRS